MFGCFFYFKWNCFEHFWALLSNDLWQIEYKENTNILKYKGYKYFPLKFTSMTSGRGKQKFFLSTAIFLL